MADVGDILYSEVEDCSYYLKRGRRNDCRGCCFEDYDEDGESVCCKPYDIDECCVAEDRWDGIDIIFKEC